jgi:hypothetical protein
MAAPLTQTTLGTLDAILKTQYLPALNEQLNNATVLFSRLEKDYDSVVGKNFTIALHTGRNESAAARAEDADLPVPGAQSYKTAIIPMKYFYGGIKLTGQTLKAAKVSEGAYITALDSEMKGLLRDMKISLNRQVWGDSTGLLTTCGTTSPASNNVVVESTANLRPGMKIDVTVKSSGATGTGALDRYVDSITDATTFVISGATIQTDNTFGVYREGSRKVIDSVLTNLECMGMSGIFSNSSVLQTLDPATQTYWKANVLTSGSNRDISETLMQTAFDTTETNSDREVSAIYTTYGVRRAYQALLTTKRQYSNTMQLKGGWTALDYNGKPMIVDKDAPKEKLFFACEDCIKFYRLSGLEWMEEDGSILCRTPNRDGYFAYAFIYHELATNTRNAQTLLEKINEVS